MIQNGKAESMSARGWKKGNIEYLHPEGGKGDTGADTSVPLSETLTPSINQVVSRPDMLDAYHRLVSKNGSVGVDGMEVSQLKPYLRESWETIKIQLESGTYEPKPVRKGERYHAFSIYRIRAILKQDSSPIY